MLYSPGQARPRAPWLTSCLPGLTVGFQVRELKSSMKHMVESMQTVDITPLCPHLKKKNDELEELLHDCELKVRAATNGTTELMGSSCTGLKESSQGRVEAGGNRAELPKQNQRARG